MIRLIAGVGAVCVVAAAGTASAENRLFTVRTDQPNVTITAATRDGKPLALAGQNGDTTYFRIDNPDGAVPCSNNLHFTASDGSSVDAPVDLCANNWSLTISTGAKGAAANAAVAPSPPPAPAPAAPPPVAAAPAAIQPLPSAPLPAPAPAPVQEAQTPPGMQWLYSATPSVVTINYGVPETENSAFSAVCQLRAARATITLGPTAPEVAPGGKVPVRFTAGTFARDYTATGSPVSAVDHASHPQLQLSTADPLWAALITERQATVAIGSAAPFGVSLSGSAAPVKQFLIACNPAPAVAPVASETNAFPLPPAGEPVPPAPLAAGPAAAFLCSDGNTIAVGFGAGSAVVYEDGKRPKVLFPVHLPGGERWVAGRAELVGRGEQVYWTRDGRYTRACTRQ